MTPQEWVTAIVAQGAVIADTRSDQLELRVPTCPGWTVADLIGHLGAIHRWSASQVSGALGVGSYDDIDIPGAPDLLEWYAAGVSELLAAIESRDVDDVVQTFVGERTVAWWCRRQAEELAVHRWDLESATQPGEQTPVNAELAMDGIDEWLDVFAPRFLRRGGGPPAEILGSTLHLHALDSVGEWFAEFTPDGLTWRRDHMKADVVLRGSTSDLLLTLWHRRPVEGLDVIGADAASTMLDLIHIT